MSKYILVTHDMIAPRLFCYKVNLKVELTKLNIMTNSRVKQTCIKQEDNVNCPYHILP